MQESLKKDNLIVNIALPTISDDFSPTTAQLQWVLSAYVLVFASLQITAGGLDNQMLRASLSIGANIREAQNAESKNDFIHKMKIAAKEADELEFYFEVCKAAGNYPDCDELLIKTQSVCKILNKIIGTTKRKIS